MRKTTPLGGTACADADPTNGDPFEFTEPVPCPLALANVPVEVDVNSAGHGVHRVDVSVVDAAGNATAVTSASIEVPADRVLDRGALNGVNATDAARLSARWVGSPETTLRSPFRAVRRIRGVLLDGAGRGIGGARIDVSALVTVPGADAVPKPALLTAPDGTWSLTVPRGISSRDLVFGYRSHVNDRIAAASVRLRLRVAAGISFDVRPRASAVGRSIVLAGRVLGRPLPPRGKLLVLQARPVGGRWVAFATVRTTSSGRFATRYRFKQAGAATYEFRALSRFEAAYPYAAAASRAVRVRKRS